MKGGPTRSKAATTAREVLDTSPTVGQLIENFDALAEAAGGAGNLRQLVLALAFRGRLTTNRPLVPAQVRGTHAAVNVARGRDATTMTMRGSAALAVGPAEMSIPEGWDWVPLVAVARLESGHTPSRNHTDYWNGGIPWIGIRDARRHNYDWIDSTEQTVSEKGLANSSARLLPAGTVYLSRTASVGYVTIMKRPMATSQDFVNWVCGDRLLPEYLMQLLRCEVPVLKRFSKGAVHQTIYFPEVKAFHISLPPVDEQKRIVAKVDQLMALCDDLEARQTKKQHLGNRFTMAALDALSTAESPAEFDVAWKRVFANFDVLLGCSGAVGELARTIRALAYSGALLGRRNSWPVSTIEEVSTKIVDCPHTTPEWTTSGLVCLRTTNFRVRGLDLEEVRYVSEATYDQRTARLKPQAGDIVYSREGGILGIACVIPEGELMCLGQRMMLIRPDPVKCLPEFVALMLNAPQTVSRVAALTGGTASPHLNVGDVKRFVVPVPTLGEQAATLARAQQMLRACDDLGVRLRHAEDRAAKLAEVVVRALVA